MATGYHGWDLFNIIIPSLATILVSAIEAAGLSFPAIEPCAILPVSDVARKAQKYVDHPEIISGGFVHLPGRPSTFAKHVLIPQEAVKQSILDHSAMRRDCRTRAWCILRAHALNNAPHCIFHLETFHKKTITEGILSHRLYTLKKFQGVGGKKISQVLKV